MTEPAFLSAGPGSALAVPWVGSPRELVDAVVGRPHSWWLRGSLMRTKSALMDEWAAAAQFPPHFGATWDALRDALADLPEGGTFLILDAEQLLREAPPAELGTLFAVLREVREDLAPKPFGVVLQVEPEHQESLLQGLQALGVL